MSQAARSSMYRHSRSRRRMREGKPERHKHGTNGHVLLTNENYAALRDEWGKEYLDKLIYDMDLAYDAGSCPRYTNFASALRIWNGKRVARGEGL